MDLKEVLQNRRSVRAFLPDPVPRDLIARVMDLARWSPSWGNTQPWEVVVADGEKAMRLADAFEAEAKKGEKPRPDITMPGDFPSPHKDRYVGLGRDLFSSMGIERGDKEARSRHYINMYRFFGAPACVYFTVDGALNEPYACLDIGSIGTTMCYAAHQEGLGTIYLAASSHFPDIIKKTLDIPETKKVVIGIAMGYPHPSAPASLFRSERLSVEDILRFG
ncbi:MAG: nitroreductase [Thermodesulfobacteriota bacterium]